MSTASNIAGLRLVENGAQTREAIAAAADALIRSHGASPRLRVVALISALRKLREVGGSLDVRAENQAARQILLEHGLERVFAFSLVPVAALTGGRTRSAFAETLRRAVAALGSVFGRSPGPFRDEWWMVW